jgi:alpha-glucosidase
MSLANPPRFRLAEQAPGRLTLAAETGARVHIFVLEDDVVRLMVLPDGGLNHARTWSIAPGEEDVATEGRDRFDLSGFRLPVFEVSGDDETLVVQTAAIRLTVRLAGLFCAWAFLVDGAWKTLARDRQTQAYDLGYWEGRPRHFLRRDPRERYFGLGEHTGEIDRAGGRYRLSNIDCMGYDAASTDPLYKHTPFYITARPDLGAAFGLFYDTVSDCEFDFGREMDNYHGLYRQFAAQHGDLDLYVIAGPLIDQVARRFTWLTGRPAHMPKWALGYSGSTMSYTDAPDAQARMAEFLENCARHDILCDSFHLSSGYTAIGDKRYVFHWNRERFPDPEGFIRSYAEAGVRLIPNIKPCLLRDHPKFAEAKAAGILISDAAGEPAWVQFWDEVGAYLDFTHPAAIDWWRANVTETLLAKGMAATWNDNNEYEIWSPNALAHGFGAPAPARETKPLQTMQMLRASQAAQRAHAPDARPFLVSRSGGVGLQRYAQTWSGDNYTSWRTLKYNLKMGLGLALSGVSNFGHDIGGFSGPAPDPELLARWVAFGVFLPRFSIHSWNDDGTVNEPWMHPQVTPVVRDLIKLRYRLRPHLYDLLWRHARDFEPVMLPTFAVFPDDPETWAPCDDYILGRDLLVAPVVEPGQSERAAYLPAGTVWRDVWTGEAFAGGQTVTRPAPLEQPVVFVRDGAAVAVNLAEQTFAARGERRGLMVFPPAGDGVCEGRFHEDDGETEGWRDGQFCEWRCRIGGDAARLTARVTVDGPVIGDRRLVLVLPPGEARALTVDGAQVVREQMIDGRRWVDVGLTA